MNIKKIILTLLTLTSVIIILICLQNVSAEQAEIANKAKTGSASTSSTPTEDVNTTKTKTDEQEIIDTSKYDKIAYITIDDGPSKYTDKIVSILNDNNVNATFFMINGNMEEYPEQVKNAVKNGNSVGFHSVSHDVNKLYKTSTSAKNEFDICSKTFTNITGKESKLVRLPFGSKPYTPEASYNNIVNAGYKIWDWTLDTEDWKSNSKQIMSNVKEYATGDCITVLIHERQQTVSILAELIQYLKSEGYTILPISQNQEEQNYWNNKLGSKY